MRFSICLGKYFGQEIYDQFERYWRLQSLRNFLGVGANTASSGPYSPDRITETWLPFVSRESSRGPFIPCNVVVLSVLPPVAVRAAVCFGKWSWAGYSVSFLFKRG